jgi:hypothetical protein
VPTTTTKNEQMFTILCYDYKGNANQNDIDILFLSSH